MLRRLLFALSLVAVPLMAQETSATIDPGMSHDDVVKRLGKPLNERSSGTHVYMFYRNGCEKSCGMNDLVVLEDGKVVDAVFRNGVRSYSGNSTSPMSLAPKQAGNGAARKSGRGTLAIPAAKADSAAPREPATITGVQVEPMPQAPPAAEPDPTKKP